MLGLCWPENESGNSPGRMTGWSILSRNAANIAKLRKVRMKKIQLGLATDASAGLVF